MCSLRYSTVSLDSETRIPYLRPQSLTRLRWKETRHLLKHQRTKMADYRKSSIALILVVVLLSAITTVSKANCPETCSNDASSVAKACYNYPNCVLAKCTGANPKRLAWRRRRTQRKGIICTDEATAKKEFDPMCKFSYTEPTADSRAVRCSCKKRIPSTNVRTAVGWGADVETEFLDCMDSSDFEARCEVGALDNDFVLATARTCCLLAYGNWNPSRSPPYCEGYSGGY